MFHWRICQCCGQQATQRRIQTATYGLLYPDLCDTCLADMSSLTGDDLYAEIKKRETVFNKHFVITGFNPIIKVKQPIGAGS